MFNTRFTSSNRKLLKIFRKIRIATDVVFWACKLKVIVSVVCDSIASLS